MVSITKIYSNIFNEYSVPGESILLIIYNRDLIGLTLNSFFLRHRKRNLPFENKDISYWRGFHGFDGCHSGLIIVSKNDIEKVRYNFSINFKNEWRPDNEEYIRISRTYYRICPECKGKYNNKIVDLNNKYCEKCYNHGSIPDLSDDSEIKVLTITDLVLS